MVVEAAEDLAAVKVLPTAHMERSAVPCLGFSPTVSPKTICALERVWWSIAPMWMIAPMAWIAVMHTGMVSLSALPSSGVMKDLKPLKKKVQPGAEARTVAKEIVGCHPFQAIATVMMIALVSETAVMIFANSAQS